MSWDFFTPATMTNPNKGRVNTGATTEMVFHAMRASENGQRSKVP